MSADLRVEAKDDVVLVTLDRPQRRNALSRAMLEALLAAVKDAIANRAQAFVLTGSGDCFSAGADIAELTGTAEDLSFDESLGEIAALLQDAPFLTLAAIEGPCVGAALDLACACDARIVTPAAFFELPAVRLGLLYNPTTIARLHGALPSATLMRLLLLAERIDGVAAMAAGLASRMAESGQAVETAFESARRVTAFPLALLHSKQLLRNLDSGAFDLAEWQSIRMQLLTSAERAAAIASAKARLRH